MVLDNGAGMPLDVMDQAFKPFFTTKGAAATGLGLAISKSIMENTMAASRPEAVTGKAAAVRPCDSRCL